MAGSARAGSGGVHDAKHDVNHVVPPTRQCGKSAFYALVAIAVGILLVLVMIAIMLIAAIQSGITVQGEMMGAHAELIGAHRHGAVLLAKISASIDNQTEMLQGWRQNNLMTPPGPSKETMEPTTAADRDLRTNAANMNASIPVDLFTKHHEGNATAGYQDVHDLLASQGSNPKPKEDGQPHRQLQNRCADDADGVLQATLGMNCGAVIQAIEQQPGFSDEVCRFDLVTWLREDVTVADVCPESCGTCGGKLPAPAPGVTTVVLGVTTVMGDY